MAGKNPPFLSMKRESKLLSKCHAAFQGLRTDLDADDIQAVRNCGKIDRALARNGTIKFMSKE